MEVRMVALNCQLLRVLMWREAAARVSSADQFGASALFIIEKAILGLRNFFFKYHSWACFIVGVREQLLPTSFSSAT